MMIIENNNFFTHRKSSQHLTSRHRLLFPHEYLHNYVLFRLRILY